MKNKNLSLWVSTIYLGWFLLIASSGWSKTEVPTNPTLIPTLTNVPGTPQNTLVPELTGSTKNYRFQSKTVWGLVNAQVKSQESSFTAEVKCDSPISGWLLLNQKTKKTVSKGGLSPITSILFKVNESFEGPYQLTIFINTGREEVPTTVQMSSLDGLSVEARSAASVEDFIPNPDKPYNSMVKIFYEKAAENYAKGDTQSALVSLKKAEELDPEQPQIQAFLKRIWNSQNPPSGKPTHETEASSKKSTLGKFKIRSTKSKSIPKTKKTEEKSLQTKTNSADQTAKADRAYNLGLESYRQEDYAAAKKFWEETLQIDPLHPQAKHNLERLKKDHPTLP